MTTPLVNQDKLKTVQSQIDNVKSVMKTNMELTLARGDQIEIVLQKTDEVMALSAQMEHDAHELKRRKQWQKIRMILIIVAIILIIVGIIVGVSYLKN